MHFIETTNEDPDLEFLEIVDRIVAEAARESGVREVFLVEIENWFSHKWLWFSGKGLVPAWLDPPRVPAFTPNRLLREDHWTRSGEGDLVRDSPGKPLHLLEIRKSSANFRRKIAGFSTSAIFAWYSSNASANLAGSLMIYVADENKVDGWYAGFRKAVGWQLHTTKEISRNQVINLMSERSSQGIPAEIGLQENP